MSHKVMLQIGNYTKLAMPLVLDDLAPDTIRNVASKFWKDFGDKNLGVQVLVWTNDDTPNELIAVWSHVHADIMCLKPLKHVPKEPSRLFKIKYCCPDCHHEWEEEYECACDSECPNCDTTNIEALSWEEIVPPPSFYECGICGHFHSTKWNGDCREDESRFTADVLDETYGKGGWVEVPMPGNEE